MVLSPIEIFMLFALVFIIPIIMEISIVVIIKVTQKLIEMIRKE